MQYDVNTWMKMQYGPSTYHAIWLEKQDADICFS